MKSRQRPKDLQATANDLLTQDRLDVFNQIIRPFCDGLTQDWIDGLTKPQRESLEVFFSHQRARFTGDE